MTAPVTIVGEPGTTEPLAAALTARGIAASSAALGGLSSVLAQSPAAIVLCFLPADSASRTLNLLARQAPSVPILVAFADGDTSLRDRALMAGAADVSLAANMTDTLNRIEAALAGWSRPVERRAFPCQVGAKLGQETLALEVTDIDATGVGLFAVDGLAPGDLLSLSLPLPDGDLDVWGRFAVLDGNPAVQFLALTPFEMALLSESLAQLPPYEPTQEPDFEPELPPEPDPPAEPEQDGGMQHTAGDDASYRSTPEQPPVEAPPPAPPEPIAQFIAESLAQRAPPPPPAMVQATVESSVTFPSWIYDATAVDAALRSLAVSGRVGETARTPGEAIIKEFVRKLQPGEMAPLAAQPPAEIADPALFGAIIGTRLQMYALRKTGEELLRSGIVRPRIDHHFLTQLGADVDAHFGGLKKHADAALTGAKGDLLRQVTQVQRVFTADVQQTESVIARVMGRTPSTPTPPPSPPPLPPLRRSELTPGPRRPSTPGPSARPVPLGQPARLRKPLIAAMAVAVLFCLYQFRPRRAPPVEPPPPVAGIAEVRSVSVEPEDVIVRVSSDWRPTSDDLEHLRAVISVTRKDHVVVKDDKDEVRYSGTPDMLSLEAIK